MIRGTTQSFGNCFFPFTKDSQTFTRLALKLQASNPETRKLKNIGVDMEGTIFNGAQSLLPDVSKLCWIRHMKQRDEIKIGKLLARFKCSENEKVFKASRKIYCREKFNGFCKIYAFLHS